MMSFRPLVTRLLAIKSDVFGGISRNFATNVDLPKIGIGVNYRRRIKFPDEYTVKPLDVQNLGGRDPVTGRKIVNGIGGGIKHKYHWVDLKRTGPKEGPPLVEKVLEIIVCGNRGAHVALVGSGDRLRYILASENMKPGDLIETSGHIPRNAVRAKEGDAHPLAALPVGTVVHNVEKFPGEGGKYGLSAGTFCTILRHLGDRIIVQLSSKREVSLARECMATVGRVSNVIHNQIPIGSAQRSRELGNRPRSGLWQRKTGRHGRKLRKLPPIQEVNKSVAKERKTISLTMSLS
ncbi:hypothetical protein R5R35_007412 [Gryllus longicercus]|uniref:Mitochondrial ribosomal protein L2 n=1 Tax=Gryllus longicercus TaxID=2509291 RepID=A0AAN9VW95_9ORTH